MHKPSAMLISQAQNRCQLSSKQTKPWITHESQKTHQGTGIMPLIHLTRQLYHAILLKNTAKTTRYHTTWELGTMGPKRNHPALPYHQPHNSKLMWNLLNGVERGRWREINLNPMNGSNHVLKTCIGAIKNIVVKTDDKPEFSPDDPEP